MAVSILTSMFHNDFQEINDRYFKMFLSKFQLFVPLPVNITSRKYIEH